MHTCTSHRQSNIRMQHKRRAQQIPNLHSHRPYYPILHVVHSPRQLQPNPNALTKGIKIKSRGQLKGAQFCTHLGEECFNSFIFCICWIFLYNVHPTVIRFGFTSVCACQQMVALYYPKNEQITHLKKYMASHLIR